MEGMKCNYCKSLLPIYNFSLNKKDKYNKSCDECLIKQKIARNKYKCEHGKRKIRCKECGGSQICPHDKNKQICKICNGSSICEHGKFKQYCKECNGVSICKHNKRSSRCKECKGGSICEHDRIKARCKECDNSREICEHNRRKSRCKDCNYVGHLVSIVGNRIRFALKNNKKLSSIKYLDCSIKEFKKHIESKFKEGMNWDNYGDWHIDHIIPLKYDNPTVNQTKERLHWTNTQPLWAIENIAKGNRFIG